MYNILLMDLSVHYDEQPSCETGQWLQINKNKRVRIIFNTLVIFSKRTVNGFVTIFMFFRHDETKYAVMKFTGSTSQVGDLTTCASVSIWQTFKFMVFFNFGDVRCMLLKYFFMVRNSLFCNNGSNYIFNFNNPISKSIL